MLTPVRTRLMRVLKRMQNDPPTGISGAPQDNNIMLWNAMIFGPDDTPWDGEAENFFGWAKNHYLSSNTLPSVKGKRLMIPCGSLDIAISRLRERETVFTKTSVNLKSLSKDEYESNFVSVVVPPEEVGVKFDDIGALEDVKRTLNELVTLPMRRPELFSHRNLLRA